MLVRLRKLIRTDPCLSFNIFYFFSACWPRRAFPGVLASWNAPVSSLFQVVRDFCRFLKESMFLARIDEYEPEHTRPIGSWPRAATAANGRFGPSRRRAIRQETNLFAVAKSSTRLKMYEKS
jgi:hypothetical protein